MEVGSCGVLDISTVYPKTLSGPMFYSFSPLTCLERNLRPLAVVGGGGGQGTTVPKKCLSELASEVIALLIAFNAPQHLW